MCYTTEDDSNWLEVSKQFLEKHNLDSSNLYIGFSQLHSNKFDFIIHDYSHVATGARADALPIAWTMLKVGCVIWIDDLNMPEYRQFILQFCKEHNTELYECLETKDKFGRYGGYIEKISE